MALKFKEFWTRYCKNRSCSWSASKDTSTPEPVLLQTKPHGYACMHGHPHIKHTNRQRLSEAYCKGITTPGSLSYVGLWSNHCTLPHTPCLFAIPGTNLVNCNIQIHIRNNSSLRPWMAMRAALQKPQGWGASGY